MHLAVPLALFRGIYITCKSFGAGTLLYAPLSLWSLESIEGEVFTSCLSGPKFREAMLLCPNMINFTEFANYQHR